MSALYQCSCGFTTGSKTLVIAHKALPGNHIVKRVR